LILVLFFTLILLSVSHFNIRFIEYWVFFFFNLFFIRITRPHNLSWGFFMLTWFGFGFLHYVISFYFYVKFYHHSFNYLFFSLDSFFRLTFFFSSFNIRLFNNWVHKFFQCSVWNANLDCHWFFNFFYINFFFQFHLLTINLLRNLLLYFFLFCFLWV